MHLSTATRPDISYVVSYVSRFMENPQDEQWVAVKRIFHYLKGTKSHGICYQPSDKIDFRGYSDADWAGDLADRKSTSGYVFMLLGAPRSNQVFRCLQVRQNTLRSVWRFKKAGGSIVCCVRS